MQHHGDDVVQGQLDIDLNWFIDIGRGGDVVVKVRVVLNKKLKQDPKILKMRRDTIYIIQELQVGLKLAKCHH